MESFSNFIEHNPHNTDIKDAIAKPFKTIFCFHNSKNI